MRAIGVRDFKEHLSQHLRTVRSGETLLITDRGEVVAEVRPPLMRDPAFPYPALLVLAERGLVELGAANAEEAYPELPPLTTNPRMQDLLDEERGDR